MCGFKLRLGPEASEDAASVVEALGLKGILERNRLGTIWQG